MELHISENKDSLSHELAAWIADDIQKVLSERDRYTFVLSGGSTPKELYKLLAAPPYHDQIKWEKVHFFFGDERYVPFDDERNNGKMAYETLLKHIAVPKEQIHYMNTTIPPEQSAQEYEKTLHQYFQEDSHTFDLVLLGIGDDGHTLSLFPQTKVIHEEHNWVYAYFVDKLDMNRITLTPPVVNQASSVIFLAAGEKKSATLKEVIEGKYNPDIYPSQVIKPTDGNLIWFIDKSAAEQLNNLHHQ